MQAMSYCPAKTFPQGQFAIPLAWIFQALDRRAQEYFRRLEELKLSLT
jgi:hypothetical protein